MELAEAACLVPAGAVLGVGGTLFTRIPLALVRAVAAGGVGDLTYVSWGGGLPLELLLQAGSVRKAVFCFSSLDLFGLAPRFRRALEEGTIETDESNALALAQALEAAGQRLPSLPLQPPAGSQILARTGLARLTPDPLGGGEVASARALRLDVLLVHATRADEDGNLELAGTLAMDPTMIAAADLVIASADEIVPRRTMQQDRRGELVPRQLVSAIVHAPFGAWPTACLPHYASDYGALAEALAGDQLVLPEPDEPTRAAARALAGRALAAAGRPPRHRRDRPWATGAPGDAETIAWALAREYDDASVCSAGAVSPLAVASYLLAKRAHAPGLTLITTAGGYVDVAWRPLLLGLGEALDFGSALGFASGDGTYHRWYQPGRITHETIAAAQVDVRGRVNSIEVTSPSGRRIRLPGQGGMADVANMHRDLLLYVPRHSSLAFVEQVAVAGAARALLTDDERRAAGLQPGRVRVVTNLGVFELSHATRRLELVGLHAGVELAEVRAQTGFEVTVSESCAVLARPTAEELALLRDEVDPLGICRLETVPASGRAELLAEVIAAERAYGSQLPESAPSVRSPERM